MGWDPKGNTDEVLSRKDSSGARRRNGGLRPKADSLIGPDLIEANDASWGCSGLRRAERILEGGREEWACDRLAQVVGLTSGRFPGSLGESAGPMCSPISSLSPVA